MLASHPRRSCARPGRWLLVAPLLLVLIALPGCFTFHHNVGLGPVSGESESDTQWYAFWGLMPLEEVQSQQLARGAADYRVTTEFQFSDVLISAFTSLFTFYCQTVTVER